MTIKQVIGLVFILAFVVFLAMFVRELNRDRERIKADAKAEEAAEAQKHLVEMRFIDYAVSLLSTGQNCCPNHLKRFPKQDEVIKALGQPLEITSNKYWTVLRYEDVTFEYSRMYNKTSPPLSDLKIGIYNYFYSTGCTGVVCPPVRTAHH
jgi:hypothetical protein